MNERGFTLIELMVVLAILLILGGVVLPSMQEFLLRSRANASISEMTSALAFARMTAITHGDAVTVCPSRDARTCMDDGDWAEGWLVFSDGNRNRRIDPDETLLRTQQTRRVPALSIRSTAGRVTLRYLPSGLSYGSNVTLAACLKGQIHAQLIMNNAGRVRIERPKGAAPACPSFSES